MPTSKSCRRSIHTRRGPRPFVNYWSALIVLIFATGLSAQTVLLGDQTIESSADSNTAGTAEAFQTTAVASGTVANLTVYLDAGSNATKVYVGLYADNSGHPGALLTQASTTTPAPGTWNNFPVSAATVTAGTRYWIAILGTGSGTPSFRDRSNGSCSSETSSQSSLTALPATWTTGHVYPDCPLSAYATSTTSSNPVLSVTPSVLAFTAVPGGSDPAPATVNVANTGGGTLNFTAATDSSWLTVSPLSGTAPQALQVSVTGSGLALGTYTGHATVTSSGTQGSPAVVTVNLTIAKPADWLMVDHDPARSGNAVDETVITTSNVGTLQLKWSAAVDGPVTAQPLFVGAAPINGQSRDAVIVATGGNSIYALDATTGATLWKKNLGAPSPNCSIPGGFGVTGAPLVDRNAGRIYTVSDDGNFHTLALSTGTDMFSPFTLISGPTTNKVWGGINQVGNNVYVASASDGCDSQPWRGQVYRIDVSTTPTLASTFVVVPGISAPDGGGGIWGYGGVAADSATGQIYAASGSDSNVPEGYTPFADRAIALDKNLNLLGSYGPPEPSQFPCSSQPCDLDFGATPVVFQPPSCPTMIAVGNKNGNLYLFKATDLAASLTPFQVLPLNVTNDSLGSGGVGGVPAYWAAGNMVFVTDGGPGINGVQAGVVGLSVNASCNLQVAWSSALGGSDQPNSTPTLANGVVFVGEGLTGRVHAYDALNGTQLWTSGSTSYSAVATFAAPTVAQGNVYVGSWSNFTGGGLVGAFSLNSTAQILSVSPTSVSFSAAQGGSNPASASVSVTNSGVGVLNFTAGSDRAWLTVTPTSGTAPQNLQLSANIAGLAAGVYVGHITVTATGAQGSPATITVTLTVTAPPVLAVTPANISFSAAQGGSNPAAATASVSNSGGGTLSFTAASDALWLTVAPASGSAPQNLQISANISGLAQGTYTGHITVTSTGVQGSPATVTVTLTVTAPAQPILTVSPTTLSVTATQGGTNPSPTNFNVSNTGGGTLSFTTASDSNWLTALPASGTAPQAVQVNVNIAGLAQGSYTGHVTVTATGVQGSPATVTVNLTVQAVGVVLLGDQAIEAQKDFNSRGVAEAFQTTASVSGTMTLLNVYLDASSNASKVYIGLYSNNNGHPGSLLVQGSSTQLSAGKWNQIPVTATGISAGTTYWFAILGTTSGTPYFRDRAQGPCRSETNRQTGLTSLPATWSTGTVYSDCPLSAYGQ